MDAGAAPSSVLGSPGSPSTVAPDSPQSPETVPESPEKAGDEFPMASQLGGFKHFISPIIIWDGWLVKSLISQLNGFKHF